DALEPLYGAIDSVETAEIRSSSLDENGNYYGAYLTGDLDLAKAPRATIVKKFTLETLGTNDRQASPIEMSIFPNPTRGGIEIAIHLAQPSSFQVFVRDIHGRLLHHYSPVPPSGAKITQRYSLPRSLSSGIYLIEVKTKNNSLMKRILLE
ncbi:MAG: T9SS type A sorting domain-containing protein, partial [Cryomorphaceae bacterium]